MQVYFIIYNNFFLYSVERCPALVSSLISSATVTHKDGTAAGSIVSFACLPGYQVEGSPVLYCQDGGTWDYPVPACSRM